MTKQIPDFKDIDFDEHMGRIYSSDVEVREHMLAILVGAKPFFLADGRMVTFKRFGDEGFDAQIWPHGFRDPNNELPCAMSHIEYYFDRTGGGGPTMEGVLDCIAAAAVER